MPMDKSLIHRGAWAVAAAAWCLAGSPAAAEESPNNEARAAIDTGQVTDSGLPVWAYESLSFGQSAIDDAAGTGSALFAVRHRIHVPDMTEQGWNYAGLRTSSGGTHYGEAFQLSISEVDGLALRAGMGAEDRALSALNWPPRLMTSMAVLTGCLGSGCFGSQCIGTGCAGSTCNVSACSPSMCGMSVCAGSGCLGSVCPVSACSSSLCGVSGCAGSGCIGSICLSSGCTFSACTREGCKPTPGLQGAVEPQREPASMFHVAKGIVTVPRWTADAALAHDRLVVICGSD